jgi:hypothetical protein
MIRLDLSAAKPRWVEVAPGVRLHVLPVDTPVVLRAQNSPELRQRVAEAGEGAGRDPEIALAVAKIVAQSVVLDWEGIGDADGKPIKPTPEGIAALLDLPPVYTAFEREVLAPAMILADEKNASAPLPTGSSARAPRTAKTAAKPARSARGR